MAFCKMLTNSSPLISRSRQPVYNPCLDMEFNLKNIPRTAQISHVIHSYRSCFKGNTCTRTGLKRVACDTKESGPPPPPPADDQRAMETVLKLFEAIKNRNLNEMSDMIAEECLFISNFISAFQPLHGKEQILAFFSYFMNKIGKNIVFTVQPTLDDGMVVGVSWRLAWDKVPLIPLGKGYSIYMCHVYQGKVMIKNMDMFMEPVLHFEPLRLKTIALLMNAIEKLNFQALLKGKAKGAYNILFALVYIAALALFSYSFWT
ncbi:uncharacterized protein LOC111402797 [Olea europaea subsp. europaea]|uniref:Uncharacterized protein LOC111402797 n=2 Tax=Olea europaea subsp. europaea TaxID=158383 RepID=A0A8S0VEK3_OLEEU|nr:uncharacterized protein LOC111402797 [Olea europaea subsp. europaea]CAA3028202.1 uncharacterized protein LOC111402797 [Olea europaea subsp. europaea]